MEVSRRARSARSRKGTESLAAPVPQDAIRRMGRLFFGVPWRFFVVGLEVTSRKIEDTRRAVAGDSDEPHQRSCQRSPAVPPAGPGPATTVSLPGAVHQPIPIHRSNRVANPDPAANPDPVDQQIAGHGVAGAEGVGGRPAAENASNQLQEKQRMSCRDQDLSGCNELKVVEYTIVSVDPYIDDCDRILAGPETIAISDEMTDSDFTAYVIALYVQGEHKPIRQCDQQYLRVCWCVQCRLVMPCPDYEKQQVEALRQIAHRLPAPDGDENGGNGGPPAKSSKSKK